MHPHARPGSLVMLLGAALLSGCAAPAEDASEVAAAALSVDRAALATARTTLVAGDPYTPIVDARPLAVAGSEPCLRAPVTVVTPGATTLEATFVSTRAELLAKLDLSAAGVPVSLAKLAGASGTAQLAVETKLAVDSTTLMFQAKGTFESELRGVGAEVPAFQADAVPRCGLGYVQKAYHRLGAVVIITIEAADRSTSISAGLGLGAGGAEGKAALQSMLQHGSYDITVRSVADVITDLEPTPLGDVVTISSTPATSPTVIAKLDRALDWLGRAQVAIAKQIQAVRANPALGAPTTKVDFVYYPGLASTQRAGLARAFDRLIASRTAYDRTATRVAAWQEFEDARDAGRGHLFNVPGAPAATVAELAKRSTSLIGAEGALSERSDVLEGALRACEEALGNRGAAPTRDTEAFVARAVAACKTVGEQGVAIDYERQFGVRRLAVKTSEVRKYDELRDDMCPRGSRLPSLAEAPIFAPFSEVTSEQGRGVWLRRESALTKSVWIKAGKIERAALFTSAKGVALCFDAARGLYE